jgi:hypothetical protein
MRTDVGYKRPPIEHQFKSGQSGNPHGRPKSSEDFLETAKRVLNEPVRISQAGRTMRMSTIKAMFKRSCIAAIKGDRRAVKVVFDLMFSMRSFEPEGASHSQVQKHDIMNSLAKMFGQTLEEAELTYGDIIYDDEREARIVAEKAARREKRRKELVARDRALGIVRT